MSYISQIQTSVPDYKHHQRDIIAFYQNAIDDESTKRKIKIIGEKAAIDTRYSVLDDFSKTENDFSFFPKNRFLIPEPTLNQRMAVFKNHALDLSLKTIKKLNGFETLKETITHIITVTCTGLYAPGLDIEIIRELGLNSSIHRTSINFMGCNAAILALKQADLICKNTFNSSVLIVCTELSTLHFQTDFSDDYLLSTSLFGDGCAAIIVSSESLYEIDCPKIKIDSFHSSILHKGKSDMTWNISDKGFILNLSSYVSELISDNIKTMLEALPIKSSNIHYWAIHPGGKKIIDDFAKVMGLSKEDLKASYTILRNYGNMSSPTVLFVLKELISSTRYNKPDESILTAAFGPGLSIETMLLRYV
ncbi:MAG: type III polyketide synthase [Bacteroidota bacterium]|nr:type III polyketide synthase [Bacteroidota bacterium]